MFYFLHRLVKWIFVGLILAGLYWVWLQREALEPVYVWYDVYENGGLQKDDRLQSVQGRAIHILDGHTFQLTHSAGTVNVRLVGFEIPVPPMTHPEQELEIERRRVLREMVLNQEVKIDATFADRGSLLGIATIKGRNINLFYITNGLSKFNREYIKSAPRDVQYQFFAAQRMREKQAQKEIALASSK
jgi:hypothetical protein